MFTGIITDIGTIAAVEKNGGIRATIKTILDMKDVAMGASIACSGVCLTVIEKTNNSFTVDISAESIACTNLDKWQIGTRINLERALKMGDELGGHIVSGHVDGLAELLCITEISGGYVMEFAAPENLAMYIATKGSVTLDGVALTVNEVSSNVFKINVIPHTLQHTTLADLSKGSKVNLEIDMLARYMARMVGFRV